MGEADHRGVRSFGAALTCVLTSSVAGKWRNGRRAGFRCQCPKGRGGSSPPLPTEPWGIPQVAEPGTTRSPALVVLDEDEAALPCPAAPSGNAADLPAGYRRTGPRPARAEVAPLSAGDTGAAMNSGLSQHRIVSALLTSMHGPAGQPARPVLSVVGPDSVPAAPAPPQARFGPRDGAGRVVAAAVMDPQNRVCLTKVAAAAGWADDAPLVAECRAGEVRVVARQDSSVVRGRVTSAIRMVAPGSGTSGRQVRGASFMCTVVPLRPDSDRDRRRRGIVDRARVVRTSWVVRDVAGGSS